MSPKKHTLQLFVDTKRGNRLSFINSVKPDYAKKLYDEFNERIRRENVIVETGIFGEHMEVSLVNDGPVTIILDSKNR